MFDGSFRGQRKLGIHLMSYTGGDKGETREIAPEGVFGLSSTLICVSEFIEFYLP